MDTPLLISFFASNPPSPMAGEGTGSGLASALGPYRASSPPFRLAVVVGTFLMERYLALEPLTLAEEIASALAVPVLFGAAIWINGLP